MIVIFFGLEVKEVALFHLYLLPCTLFQNLGVLFDSTTLLRLSLDLRDHRIIRISVINLILDKMLLLNHSSRLLDLHLLGCLHFLFLLGHHHVVVLVIDVYR